MPVLFRSVTLAAVLCLCVFSSSFASPADPAQSVPVSSRGMFPHFERTVQACLFRGNEWLLPHQDPADVVETMAAFAPTFISGAFCLAPGESLDPEIAEWWLDLRAAMQQANSVVNFDLVMDLHGYASADDAVRRMQEAAAVLPAEAWTFTGVAVEKRVPGLLAAVIAEAHSQGRTAGALLGPGESVPGLDYAVVSYGNGGKDLGRRIAEAAASQGASGKKKLPVILWNGAAGQSPGEGFAVGKTPAQRRLQVMDAAKMQKKGVAYAYPVFGPLAAENKAYDSLRDEFMIDTLRRCMQAQNPVTRAVPLVAP